MSNTPKISNDDIFTKLFNAGILEKDSSNMLDLVLVPNTQFLYGGLNIMYGVDGTGKSWQTSAVLKNSGAVNFYIDTDGSNGKQFFDHCTANNVQYIGFKLVASREPVSIKDKVIDFIEHLCSEPWDGQLVFVIDSLTSVMEGMRINNAEDISPTLYEFNALAEKHNICIILIDHATEGLDYPDNFKLEGNAGAKRRTTVTINRYVANDRAKPSEGGTFKCERARGNSSGLSKGDTQTVATATLADARAFVIKKSPSKGTTMMSQHDFTKMTKNTRDHWVRSFKDQLFDTTLNGKTTELTLKKV